MFSYINRYKTRMDSSEKELAWLQKGEKQKSLLAYRHARRARV